MFSFFSRYCLCETLWKSLEISIAEIFNEEIFVYIQLSPFLTKSLFFRATKNDDLLNFSKKIKLNPFQHCRFFVLDGIINLYGSSIRTKIEPLRNHFPQACIFATKRDVAYWEKLRDVELVDPSTTFQNSEHENE